MEPHHSTDPPPRRVTLTLRLLPLIRYRTRPPQAPTTPSRQTTPRGSKGSPFRSLGIEAYRAPGWFTRNVFNQLLAFLTRQGISVLGSRVLAVKGRTSGQWGTTPVNLLAHDGRRYLVAPRGEIGAVTSPGACGCFGWIKAFRRAWSGAGRVLMPSAHVRDDDVANLVVDVGEEAGR